MNEAIDFSTLNWVKTELDESLKQGRQALESYVGNPSDTSQLDVLETCLHQVHGTLQMVEIYGAAMLAEEMQQLASALKVDKIRQRDDAYDVLMRSILQLPDYLDRLAAGNRDVPIVLLPLLNDLRALRGEHLLSESRLFSPDLTAALPAGAGSRAATADARRSAKEMRHRYQVGLLGVFRDHNVDFALNTLGQVAESMVALSSGDSMARVWWIAGGAIAALKDQSLTVNAAIKLLLGKLDRCLRNAIEEDESAISRAEIDELSQNLLFYVGQSESQDPVAVEIREAFRLSEIMPGKSDIEAAKESLAGSNTSLFKTVANVLKEELSRLKQGLDGVIRDGGGNSAELPQIAEGLRAMSDTLGMLGMGGQRQAVLNKACALEEAVDAGGMPAESFLMEVAGTLILVESALDGMAHGKRAVSAEGGDIESTMAQSEFDQVRDVVLNEVIVDLTRGKESFVNYTKEAQDASLGETVQHFSQVKGGLLLLGEKRAASLIGGALLYIRQNMVNGSGTPEQVSLERLADVVCGVEYYIEGLRERRLFSEAAVEKAELSLKALGVQATEQAQPANADGDEMLPDQPESPSSASATDAGLMSDIQTPVAATGAAADGSTIPQEDESAQETEEMPAPRPFEGTATVGTLSTDVSPESEASGDQSLDALILSSTASFESADAGAPADNVQPEPEIPGSYDDEMAGLSIIGDDNDTEITEIFVEEAEEEIGSICERLPVWMENVDDKDALSTLRRSFHTLKGSGRLVGAKRIGEFAWAFESMLNRVIEGTLSPSPVMFDLLDKALQTLPVLVAQVKTNVPLTLPAHKIMAAAHAIVEGSPVQDYWPEQSELSETADGGLASSDDQADVPDEISECVAIEDIKLESDETIALEQALFSDGVITVDVEHERHYEHQPEVVCEPAGSGALMDPVLYEIFNSESIAHLDAVDRYLDSGVDHVTDELLRALHTLHGSANMASVAPMAETAGVLERYFRSLSDAETARSESDLDMLRAGRTIMRDILAKLPGQVYQSENTTAFIKRVKDAQEIISTEIESANQLFDSALESLADPADAVLIPGGNEEPPTPEEPAYHNTGSVQIPPSDAENAFDVTPDEYAQFDDELLQIFIEESGEIAERSEDALARWLGDNSDLVALEQLQRELHTLKGGARMAELTPVASLTHALETVIAAIAENRVKSPEEAIERCVAGHDVLLQQLERVRQRAPMFDASGTIAALEAVSAFVGARHEEPLPGDTHDIRVDAPVAKDAVDQELTQIFLEEAGDVIEQIDSALQAWRRSPADNSPVAELQRHLHTLKGGARMAGVNAIGDLAHAMESAVQELTRDGAAVSNVAVFGVLENSLDRIVAMVGRLTADEPLEPADELCQQLETLRGEQLSQAVDAGETSSSGYLRPEIARVEDFRNVERRAQPREAHELVRVRADLLDSLVNNAGEVSIYRSRIEQQVGALRFNLMEMDQTVVRLREQLRKLEIETEAQILFRYEREFEARDADFDPLELDRYSQLQQLSRSLMESVADLNSLQNLLENVTRESETLLLQQARVNTELQEGLMRTRMVPFLGLAPRLRRIVRQTCQELGKKATLELSGADGELDRTVIDRIVAPIEHMLRNAISHGIEAPADRVAQGKPDAGSIRITFGRESSDVVLSITDDGAGIDLERVREKAIERGLMDADAALSDNQVLQFILETGFSTAKEVSLVSGRGVGMDVVNSEVRQLGGALHIQSRRGAGTTFTIRLPFTLAINQSLLVEVSENTYAIPLSSIQGIVRLDRDELLKHYSDPELKLEYGGTEYDVRYLGELLGARKPNTGTSQGKVPMLLARAGEHVMALQVDNLLGSREVVVKSVGPQISTVRGISGATILGDGRVVMILDVAALLRGGISPLAKVEEIVRRAARKDSVTVMVVDDSITVRKVTGRLLERHGMRVVTAKDGVDAVAKLNEVMPDIMLLDIEMPRMDGFELATHVRNEPALRHVPIVMITSRTGDKHRQRAMEIGVDRYLGKPFQEGELLETINSLLGRLALNG